MIVKNNKTFVTYVGDIFFIPGTNTIDSEKAEILQDSDDFQNKVRLGVLSLIGANGDTEQITNTTSEVIKQVAKKVERIDISKLNVDSATKVIKNMYSLQELKEIKSKDFRKGVQEAVANQMKKIDEATAKPAKEDVSDEDVYEDEGEE